MKTNYLTDKELQQLISDVEEHNLVQAPCSLVESVIDKLPSEKKSEQKILEFRRYCVEICIAMAASIILLFGLPAILNNPDIPRPSKQETYLTKAEYISNNIPSRDELINNKQFSLEAFIKDLL